VEDWIASRECSNAVRAVLIRGLLFELDWRPLDDDITDLCTDIAGTFAG